MSDETPTLASALIAAAREVQTLPKLHKHQKGFTYAKADHVVRAARILLAKHGLAWVRTGASVTGPVLAAGRIGNALDYVGDVNISGVIVHAAGKLEVSASMPIVAMAATPHDKATAASVTFCTGYLLLGVLNQDRADSEEINDRPDPDEPTCSREVADELRQQCTDLAKLSGVDGAEMWDWACAEAGVPKGSERYPGPGELYAAEAADVGKLLMSTIEGRRPHVNNPDPGAIKGLVRELVELRKDPASKVWKDCLARAGITGEPQPRELTDADARKVNVILETMATKSRVDAKVDDDQRQPDSMNRSGG